MLNKSYCEASEMAMEWSRNKAESIELVHSALLEGAEAVRGRPCCAGPAFTFHFDLATLTLT